MTQSIDLQLTDLEARLILQTIEEALRAAGAVLAKDLLAPAGPRGRGHKAPADTEAERLIRSMIQARFPDHQVIGEELDNERPKGPTPFLWLIDPNDGTRSYIQGYRGSAVSIGLLYKREPIAGGVYAYAYPNHSGDLIMGGLPEVFGGVTRNGELCPPSRGDLSLDQAVIAISQGADTSSLANSEQLSPARYLAIPSVAYRLALAAVDEVQVGVSVNGPVDYDLAGGHALLRAQGRELFTAPGVPYVYYKGGGGSPSAQFVGGDPELCAEVLRHNLSAPRYQKDPKSSTEEVYPLSGPVKRKSELSTDARLSRAQGALLGMMSGDALGSLVEFQSAKTIAAQYPQGVTQMRDGGTFNKIAGQVTDDSEMAISLARSIVVGGGYKQAEAALSYARWLESQPFDVGITTRTALGPALHCLRGGGSPDEVMRSAIDHASRDSQANGALMRITPLALYAAGRGLSDDDAAQLARLDAEITHPHQVCQDANAVFVVALKRLILTGEGAEEVYQHTLSWAEGAGVADPVLERLRWAAQSGPSEGKGWVLIALQAAFYALLHFNEPQEAISWAISLGADTDTNAAIVGALVGAGSGLEALPRSWVRAVITSRPTPELGRGRCYRPKWLWSCDALLLAEQLTSLPSRSIA